MFCPVGQRIQIFSRPPLGCGIEACPGSLVFAAGLAASGGLLAGTAAAAEESAPFLFHAHDIQGLIRPVWLLRVSQCAAAESDLLVLRTNRAPPDLEKRLTWMPCGSALVPGDPRALERRLRESTVLIDIARIPERQGPQ